MLALTTNANILLVLWSVGNKIGGRLNNSAHFLETIHLEISLDRHIYKLLVCKKVMLAIIFRFCFVSSQNGMKTEMTKCDRLY